MLCPDCFTMITLANTNFEGLYVCPKCGWVQPRKDPNKIKTKPYDMCDDCDPVKEPKCYLCIGS